MAIIEFKKAAEEGHIEVTYSLGYMYNWGRGVAMYMPRQAAIWYERTTEQEHARANSIWKNVY